MELPIVTDDQVAKVAYTYFMKDRKDALLPEFIQSRMDQMEAANPLLVRSLNCFVTNPEILLQYLNLNQTVVRAFGVVGPYELLGGFEKRLPEVQRETIVGLMREIKEPGALDNLAMRVMNENRNLWAFTHALSTKCSRDDGTPLVAEAMLGIQYALFEREIEKINLKSEIGK